MAEKKEISNTLGGADLGHLKDVGDGDFSEGYFDAAPTGNYEGSLEDPVQRYDFDSNSFKEEDHPGTLHAGQIEADGFERTHGDSHGFVRRPTHKTDIERN